MCGGRQAPLPTAGDALYRNMRFQKWCRNLAVIGLLGLNASTVYALTAEEAEDIRKGAANFKYHTVTTKEGLTFRVPEDLPVVTRDGIQAPLPFDEYMYGKFKQIDERLKSIDSKLDRLEDALESRKPSDKESKSPQEKILKG